jgi:hypothetical protein
MRNKYDDEDDYNYSKNELAELSIDNPKAYRQIISSNLSDEDTIDRWEQRNLEWAQSKLNKNN